MRNTVVDAINVKKLNENIMHCREGMNVQRHGLMVGQSPDERLVPGSSPGGATITQWWNGIHASFKN
jgi:hypothetical protein